MRRAENRAACDANRYYNEALDRAGIRDLAGARDCLLLALRFNKNHMQARNLLGLIYYEQGEVAAALSEWKSSWSIGRENNPAKEYFDEVTKDANRLKILNAAGEKYNEALRQCHAGHLDIAAETLRRAISDNPKLVRAYQLLALLELKQANASAAGKLLIKAGRIDAHNPLTIRYQKEAGLFEKKNLYAKARTRRTNRHPKAEDEASTVMVYNASAIGSILNIIVGVVVGILASWFLIVPSVRKDIRNETNQKINAYASQMESQKAIILSLQDQLEQNQKDLKKGDHTENASGTGGESSGNPENIGSENTDPENTASGNTAPENTQGTGSSENNDPEQSQNNPASNWEGTITGDNIGA